MNNRTHMILSFEGKTFSPDPRAEPVRPELAPKLADCMLDGDLDLVDYAGESPEEMTEEIERAFAGSYGPFLSDASFCVLRDGEVVSAILMTMEDDLPLVAFIFTRKAFGRQGLSKALLSTAFYTLQNRGYTGAHLYCDSHSFAAQLYRAVGFEEAEA